MNVTIINNQLIISGEKISIYKNGKASETLGADDVLPSARIVVKSAFISTGPINFSVKEEEEVLLLKFQLQPMEYEEKQMFYHQQL